MHITNTLSPLKKLAFQRICAAQKNLGKRNLYPRYATEVEFVATNSLGDVVNNPIKIEDFKKAFADSPYISAIAAEGDRALATNGKAFNQMEITINGQGLGRATAIKMPDERMSPKCIVPATDIVKRQLRDLCQDHGIWDISFSPTHPKGMFGINSGYHSNMSLYDKDGTNLFGTVPEFYNHCAEQLMQSQHEGALMLLPQVDSFKRLGNTGLSFWKGTPSRINHSFSKGTLRPSVHNIEISSVASRSYHPILSPYLNRLRERFPNQDQVFRSFSETSPDFNRLENRLAGADSCPYMVGAFDMATLEHAVNNFEGKPVSLKPRCLAHTLEDAIEHFASSEHMKTILGKDLHSAYLSQYLEPLAKGTEQILR